MQKPNDRPSAGGPTRHLEPAWRRAFEGEARLPVALAITAAIVIQIVLPGRRVVRPEWLLPSLEAALLAGLVVANPGRINRNTKTLRAATIALVALISFANAATSEELIRGLVEGTNSDNASVLLGRGASVYLTNILVFSLWYWEWDRGGPALRAKAARPFPDFLFPQMATPEITHPDWRPTYVDYLYVSYTNATAFSPTDTMPLVPWAKMLMALQSTIALLTEGLVIARAVNVLK